MFKKLTLFIIIVLLGIGFCINRYYYAEQKYLMEYSDRLRVGTNAEYPPFSFIDENGIVVGFDIDIIGTVAQRLGKTVDIVDMPFDALVPAIQIGYVHAVAAGMTPSLERARMILFTDLYFSGDPLVVVRLANAHGASAISMVGARVVVNEGYTADYYASALPGIVLSRLSSVSDALLSLVSERADYFITAKSSLWNIDRVVNQSFKIEIIDGTEERLLMDADQ